ncbi:MAG: hypothetical protein ACMZ63_10925 [Methylotenera sp.]|jgi:hypothetical protein
MKNASLLIKLLIMACLSAPSLALAAEAKSAANNETYQCDANEFNLMPIGTEEDAAISYVTGGICVDEAEMMKSIANNFPLEIVLVEKSDEYEKENYIADVRVVITDTKKEKKYLDVYTEGPFLLVNLPDNRYLITADHNGVSKEYKVNIDNKKHKRIVFLWPAE